MDRRGLLLCLLSAAAFGSMAILARGAYAAGMPIGTLLVGRFALAAVAFWALVWFLRTALPSRRTQRHSLALGAAVYAVEAALFFIAISRLSATLAALLLYLYPFMVFLAGVLRGTERATRDRVLPLAMAGLGVGLVLSAGAGTQVIDPVGVAAAVSAAMIYTGYLLVSGPIGVNAEPLATSALVMTGAAGATAAVAAGTGELSMNFALSGWLWLLALALGSTVIGVWSLTAGLKRVGATNASIISTSEPIVTVGLAMLLLGESLAPLQLVGAAGVLLALILLQRAEPVSVSDDGAATRTTDRTAARTLAHEPA